MVPPMNEAADLLKAGRVVVWNGPEKWRLKGMDVVHGDLHLTVGPVGRDETTWTVLVVNDLEPEVYVRRNIVEALTNAGLKRGVVVDVYEVTAPNPTEAGFRWRDGKRLFQFAWLGA